jgi:hypothetical protein
MRKIIYALILAVMMTSCMTYQGFYTVGLQNVERPENAKERYGESKIVNFEEEGKTKYSYEDDMIKIVWLPLSTQFGFTLQNKTDHSIKIIWDITIDFIKSIALNKSTKTKFYQIVINVRPHYSCVIFLLIRNENDPKHRLSIGLHRSLLGWAPTPPQGRQKR